MKTCTLCKLPQTETNFGKRSASADGLNYKCKPCLKVYVSKYSNHIVTLSHKICNNCKRDLSVDLYFKDKHNSDGLRSACKQCINYSHKYAAGVFVAKRRNIIWDISRDEYYSIINGADCHYCGGNLPHAGYGLDRKDNSQGYARSNVVPCCAQCNDTKSNYYTYEEMIKLSPILRDIRLARTKEQLT